MSRTRLLGIANPSPMLPAEPPAPVGMDAIELLIPMTRPAASKSGPPEFPGLMAASTWMAFVVT